MTTSALETDAGYVVHLRRLRETSLLVQLYTREHGRLHAVARGALTPRKGAGRAPMEFSPYFLAWSRGRDLAQLRASEPAGRPLRLTGDRLISGLYVNELVVRLTRAGDPEPVGYAAYEAALLALAGDAPLEPILRQFETRLLQSCGFGIDMTHAVDDGGDVQPDRRYFCVPELGVLQTEPAARHCAASGAALLALAGMADWDVTALRDAKRLMRFLIAHHLPGEALRARRLFSPRLADQDRAGPD